jgi:hypothetical protein
MSDALCFACESSPRAVGLLCAACADGLTADGLCPQQIRARRRAPEGGAHNAWLLDGYGEPHSVAVDRGRGVIRVATVGRAHANDLAIAESTVSLVHAHLERRERSGAWFVADQGSENGTFVNGDATGRRFPLEPGDRLFFGRRIGFVFLPLDDDQLTLAQRTLRAFRAQTNRVATRADAPEEETAPALRVSAVTEGGAVCSWGEERVSLSELEYELLVLLWRQWESDDGADDAARGFAPAAQLIDALSFSSDAPTHNNLRVLVRKVRRKLAECEPPVDIIESRKGFGYRVARPLVLG